MKSGNTVILPILEKRINPVTRKEEVAPSGMVAEFFQGKQVSAPFKMPTMAPAPQGRAGTSSLVGPEETQSVSLYSPDTRSLAQHYQRPGETTRQAAERLADAAVRFEGDGSRAGAAVNANGQRFFGGTQ